MYNIIWLIIFYLSIAALWQVAEYTIYGKVTPRIMDDVIAVVLAISLFYNFK